MGKPLRFYDWRKQLGLPIKMLKGYIRYTLGNRKVKHNFSQISFLKEVYVRHIESFEWEKLFTILKILSCITSYVVNENLNSA